MSTFASCVILACVIFAVIANAFAVWSAHRMRTMMMRDLDRSNEDEGAA